MKKEEYIRRFTMYQVVYIRGFTIYQVGYTHRFTIYKDVYTRGIADQKSRMCMHALSCMEKHVHVGRLIFGFVVFRPMVLVLGILFEVLNPGIGSLVLVLNGFGPWY